ITHYIAHTERPEPVLPSSVDQYELRPKLLHIGVQVRFGCCDRLMAKEVLGDVAAGRSTGEVGSRVAQFVHWHVRQAGPVEAPLEPAVDTRAVHRPGSVLAGVEQVVARPVLLRLQEEVEVEGERAERRVREFLPAAALDPKPELAGRSADVAGL